MLCSPRRANISQIQTHVVVNTNPYTGIIHKLRTPGATDLQNTFSMDWKSKKQHQIKSKTIQFFHTISHRRSAGQGRTTDTGESKRKAEWRGNRKGVRGGKDWKRSGRDEVEKKEEERRRKGKGAGDKQRRGEERGRANDHNHVLISYYHVAWDSEPRCQLVSQSEVIHTATGMDLGNVLTLTFF